MGEDPLIAAVRSGDVKAVAALLDAGANPDTVDEHGTPALCMAADAFDLPVAEVLMPADRPVDVNRAAADGRTPLLRAIDGGAREITSVLISKGADLRSFVPASSTSRHPRTPPTGGSTRSTATETTQSSPPPPGSRAATRLEEASPEITSTGEESLPRARLDLGSGVVPLQGVLMSEVSGQRLMAATWITAADRCGWVSKSESSPGVWSL
ncbi:ankyrin repeat domain-containing protein [Streptomyces sp. NPDC050636]|uniref:ankyrin repeat domain-containing protein n=1 Tax=Streptomyces sp. NPDC050636 TaxID=3154510 RepID=UPI0034131A3F